MGTLEMTDAQPLVGIIMGSQSDWSIMRHAVETLEKLGISNEATSIRTRARCVTSSGGGADLRNCSIGSW